MLHRFRVVVSKPTIGRFGHQKPDRCTSLLHSEPTVNAHSDMWIDWNVPFVFDYLDMQNRPCSPAYLL